MTDSPRLLQLSPNPAPPFADICELYEKAAAHLGISAQTWFLQPGRGAAPDNCLAPAGATTRDIARALQRTVAVQPTLLLCHRYRSYKVARISGIRATHKIVVAHEFELFKRWQRRLEYRLFGRAFEFAGVSAAVSEQLSRTTGHEITLPNGIDVDAATTCRLPREQARELLGIPMDDTFTVGVVGRLHPKKRPQLASRICANWPQPLRLVYVGDGELRAELDAQLSSGNGSNVDVRFTGFVPDAKRAYAALDALLITSSSKEAFGMVALEALAASLPVVAPAIPGPSSVLGDLGFYYPDSQIESNLVREARIALQRAQTLCAGDALQDWQQRAKQRVAAEFSVPAIATRLQSYL